MHTNAGRRRVETNVFFFVESESERERRREKEREGERARVSEREREYGICKDRQTNSYTGETILVCREKRTSTTEQGETAKHILFFCLPDFFFCPAEAMYTRVPTSLGTRV